MSVRELKALEYERDAALLQAKAAQAEVATLRAELKLTQEWLDKNKIDGARLRAEIGRLQQDTAEIDRLTGENLRLKSEVSVLREQLRESVAVNYERGRADARAKVNRLAIEVEDLRKEKDQLLSEIALEHAADVELRSKLAAENALLASIIHIVQGMNEVRYVTDDMCESYEQIAALINNHLEGKPPVSEPQDLKDRLNAILNGRYTFSRMVRLCREELNK